MPNSEEFAAADHILLHCGALRDTDNVLVIGDEATAEIARLFAERARPVARSVDLQLMTGTDIHGREPPAAVSAAMKKANLIVGLTVMSIAHTQARYRATQRGARYLSMPDYSWELLSDPSMLVDYIAAEPEVERIAQYFTEGSLVHVTSAAGTDISIAIAGRQGNACPGTVRRPGMLGSPPDIEANVAPLESGSNGSVVVDGSIPCRNIGLLASPVILQVEHGKITKITGEPTTVATLNRMFEAAGDASRVLAECGVGLNRRAQLQGKMLTDEGAFGCLHFGFGANSTIGGANNVPFHLDFVFRRGGLSIDGRPIMVDGELVI
jgi:2,5-dihydroxypyridine 5,6-dioxygenase